jgi:hypothetical protein
MHAGCGFTDFDRLYYIWMLNTLTVSRFANEAGNGRFVLPELFSQDLHGNYAVDGMFSTEDSGSSALPYLTAKGVASKRSTHQVLFRHERT